MAVAAKKKDQTPDDLEAAAMEFTRPFYERYGKAEQAALRSAELTSTDAWADIYRRGMARWESARSGVVHDLEQLAELLRQNREPSEDDLKAVKEALKSLSEAHASHNAWWANNIAQLVAAATGPGGVIDDAEREARTAEQANPLLSSGLAAAVKRVVSTWTRYEFDTKTGRIEPVIPP